jgi:hypothetical protein
MEATIKSNFGADIIAALVENEPELAILNRATYCLARSLLLNITHCWIFKGRRAILVGFDSGPFNCLDS